jgi:hypothetical protein
VWIEVAGFDQSPKARPSPLIMTAGYTEDSFKFAGAGRRYFVGTGLVQLLPAHLQRIGRDKLIEVIIPLFNLLCVDCWVDRNILVCQFGGVLAKMSLPVIFELIYHIQEVPLVME